MSSAVVGRLEDDIVTPGANSGILTLGAEDNVVTTGPTKGPQVPTTAKTTKNPGLEDLSTPGSSIDGQTSTTTPVTTHLLTDTKTSHPSRGKVDEEAQTTDKNGGLATVALVGIIVGVLLAIGFIGGVMVVVMRKVSGRFSP
ncbi:podoplanin isoform 2-T3 [Thomomys bottae]